MALICGRKSNYRTERISLRKASPCLLIQKVKFMIRRNRSADLIVFLKNSDDSCQARIPANRRRAITCHVLRMHVTDPQFKRYIYIYNK